MIIAEIMYLYLTILSARLGAISETKAVLNLFKVIQILDFDAHLLTMQASGLVGCQSVTERIMKNHKQRYSIAGTPELIFSL